MKFFGYFFISTTLFACSRKISTETASAVLVDSIATTVTTQATATTPPCILQKIDSIKKEHIWNPPAEIHEYEKEGRKVYLISADCCDRFTTAYDENCDYICAPAGGFTGRGDRKCGDFFEKAKHIRLVWKDER